MFLYFDCEAEAPVTKPLPIEGQPEELVEVGVLLKFANIAIVVPPPPPDGVPVLVGVLVLVGVFVLVLVLVGVLLGVLVLVGVLDAVLVGVLVLD